MFSESNIMIYRLGMEVKRTSRLIGTFKYLKESWSLLKEAINVVGNRSSSHRVPIEAFCATANGLSLHF